MCYWLQPEVLLVVPSILFHLSGWYLFGCTHRPMVVPIGHVNEYPTMHCFGNPRHTQSMIVYMIWTEYFWRFQ